MSFDIWDSRLELTDCHQVKTPPAQTARGWKFGDKRTFWGSQCTARVIKGGMIREVRSTMLNDLC